MRALLRSLGLALLLAGCGGAQDPKQADEIAALKKRITKLENRVRHLESRVGRGKGGKAPARGKAPRGKAPARGGKPATPPPAGPMRVVEVEGDAKAVMLTSSQRRFRLPGKAPVGTHTVLAAFGDAPLARIGQLEIPTGDGSLVVVCDSALNTCVVKETP